MSTSVPRRRNKHEQRLQIYLVRQFRKLVDPLAGTLVAIENGAEREAKTLELLHAMGVLNGIPDLLLLGAGRKVRFIEVKLAATAQHLRTDLSEAQADVHLLLHWYGFRVDVVRTAAEFWAIVDEEGIAHGARPAQHEQLTLLAGPRRKRLVVPS